MSHLLFVDDSFMFLEANLDKVRISKEILDCYSTALGQLVKFDKSEMCFEVKVRMELQMEVAGFSSVSGVINI